MICTSIAAALLVAGIPGFGAYLAFQRTSNAANQTLRDLIVARSESARTGISTSLLPADGSWHHGWTVSRTDIDSNGIAHDTMLAERGFDSATLTLAVCGVDGGSPVTLEFDSIGALRTPANGAVIQFRSQVGGFVSVREVVIEPSGRAHIWRRDESTPALSCT